jgi:glycosyltransferase involved in cell wall biosynthesis
MALASILIPVFNRAELVLRTIESSQAQTLKDIEIIVVDNCSTDGTFEAARACANKDSRIRVYRNETNIGPVRNWRRCAELATSPYCKLLFSDDLIAPTFLEKTIPHLICDKTAFAYTPVICGETEWKGTLIYRAFQNDCKFVREFFLRSAMAVDYFSPVSPGAAVFRKTDLLSSLLDSLPGVEGYDFAGTGAGVDLLIYLITALRYEHVAYVDEPLAYFKAHAGSISAGAHIPLGYSLAKQWLRERVKGL